ncbi:CPBP family intramembrane glutamic endopeptidase [Desulfosudis oleivorans]|uniref:Abortive infection protein n=1 Tax=Desulfosudis oleivorans (strain DSM 6200 / JCM 39069 / Hxd3) TaxID=96561 RepID=A8ZWH3_DESOH|nr:CPBP family intramembrane glutamic endopeptidase [Desulfosudis oleivorans]ABW66781.1 Abortive infection protein [Desulfosudis oleivorans Hxd3]
MGAGTVRLTTLCAVGIIVVATEATAGIWVDRYGFRPMVVLLVLRGVQISLILGAVWGLRRGLAEVGLSRSALGRGVKAGLVWSALFGGIVAIAGTALLAMGTDPRTFFAVRLPEGDWSVPLYYVTGSLAGPLWEELVFRGVLYGFFRRYGVAAGIVISTAVFAALHLRGPVLPVTQIVGGVVFCLAYEKEKSLAAPFVIHALGNTAIFTLALI